MKGKANKLNREWKPIPADERTGEDPLVISVGLDLKVSIALVDGWLDVTPEQAVAISAALIRASSYCIDLEQGIDNITASLTTLHTEGEVTHELPPSMHPIAPHQCDNPSQCSFYKDKQAGYTHPAPCAVGVNWVQQAIDAGIPLGTKPGHCGCGCNSYRVKGAGTYVSAWVDPEHTKWMAQEVGRIQDDMLKVKQTAMTCPPEAAPVPRCSCGVCVAARAHGGNPGECATMGCDKSGEKMLRGDIFCDPCYTDAHAYAMKRMEFCGHYSIAACNKTYCHCCFPLPGCTHHLRCGFKKEETTQDASN